MSDNRFYCKYCAHYSTLTGKDYFENWQHINVNKTPKGNVGVLTVVKRCPNSECMEIDLAVSLTRAACGRHSFTYFQDTTKTFKSWNLLPESEAKVFPDYIPSAIIEDYEEACKIKNLSPKASATLARRCLQGMIRDFFGISMGRLIDEINAIEDRVNADVFSAIDAVRSVGNIGAHMEKDINLIIDVEPQEAQLLIALIEQLIDDWYISRETRKNRLKQITLLAEDKKSAKNIPIKDTKDEQEKTENSGE